MLHTYYRHREDHTIRQYELEDFLYLYRGYKALGGNSFIDRIKSEIDEWEVVSRWIGPKPSSRACAWSA